MDVVSTFLHTTTQVVVGIMVGTVADGVFPSQVGELRSGDLPGFLMLGAEVTGQLMLTGLVTWAYIKTMEQLPPEMQDKTLGGAFLLTSIASQQHLNAKIGRLSSYTADVFRQFTGRKNDGEHTTEMRDIVREPGNGNRIISQRTRRVYSNYNM